MKRLLMMIGAAAIVAMADVALATDLDNYYFRYDFSSGSKVFHSSDAVKTDPLKDKSNATDMTVLPVEGPDGPNTAVHPLNEPWSTIGSNQAWALFNNDWTCAMSVRPGSTQNGVIFSIGRKNAASRKNISICASSEPTKLLVDQNKNVSGKQSSLDSQIELDNDVNVSNGFHTIVAVHKKPASGNAGTIDFYVDGVYQKRLETLNYEFGGAFQFCKTCSDLTDGEKSTMDDLDVAFRDLRFYSSAFTEADVKKYAALFPADGLRKSAFVRAYGGNAVDTDYSVTPQTRIGIDCQYTDLTTGKRMFGAGEYNHESLGCAFYIQGNSEYAHIFNDKYNYTDSSLKSIKATVQRVTAVLDRVAGKSYLWHDGSVTPDDMYGIASGDYPALGTLPLFAEKTTTVTQNWSKAMIYSVDIQESGSLVHFFAPHLDATYGAGFMDVITGEFKGEAMESPTTALTYNDGFGSSADYKYENGTLYAKVYAEPVNTAQGTVAVSASGETLTPEEDGSYWVAYNTTLTLAATPESGYAFAGWAGDKNALQSGTTATASITVLVDRATQFEARFTPIERFHADGGYAASGERSAATAVDPNDVDLVIAEDAYGFEGVEAAGSYMVNGSHSFRATTATSDVFGGTAVGYKLERWNRDTKAWDFVSYGGGNTFDYTNCVANGRMRLTWFWQQTGQVRKYGVGDYIQYDSDYPSTLLAHFDGILNAGASDEHETSPSNWVNLVAGGFNLATNNAPAFSSDAWVSDFSSCFFATSDAVKNALVDKSFTLEMMISHPSTQNDYEYWAYLGKDGSTRQLVVDLRKNDSKNCLVQGVQYRDPKWDNRTKLGKSSITEWGKRQYIAVVCDSTAATTYCDGDNQIHLNTGGSLASSKFKSDIFIGASFNKDTQLYAGSEICAIRMTAGALDGWQLEYNNAIDQVRFNGNVTIVNGAVGETDRVGESSATDGVYDVASGTWTITAEPVKVGDKTYHPRLTVETLTDGEWAQPSNAWTDSYTVDKAKLDSSRIRLTWTWAIRPGLLISFH